MLLRHPFRLLAFAVLLPACATANVLSNADGSKWKVGSAPGKPWQHSGREDGITVKMVKHDNATWLELHDDSSSSSANLRQEFPALQAGRLTLKLMVHAESSADFGIYLGSGNASSTAERVVDVKTNQRGMLRLGSGGERINTDLTLRPGVVEHIFIEFRPDAAGVHLKLGRIGADGKDEILGENTFAKPAQPVTRLRITSDNAPTGARWLITDLKLVPIR